MSEKLDSEIISEKLRLLGSMWKVENDTLVRDTLEFDSFEKAIEFINSLATVISEIDHHPDVCISYKNVDIKTSSHSAGGITNKDFTLADEVEKLVLMI